MAERKDNLTYHDSPWILLLAGSLIVLAGYVAYSNSFLGPFVFDDEASIPSNPTIWHLWPIGPVFSPPNHGETVSGRPILNLSFAIDYALSGTKVWGYHATNLVIHLLNGLLLLGILRRTFLLPTLQSRFGRAALLLASAIALLWVVHPLQTESVTYIVQRAESLASLFYLLVLYAVIRGQQPGSFVRTIGWYGLAVAACWLGVATKEIVVTAPVVVLFYDRTFLAGTLRPAWRQRWGLYAGLASAWLVMVALMLAIGGRAESAGFGHGMSSWEYAATQGGAILHYLRLALWPTGLCLYYGNSLTRTTAEILPGALLILILVGLTGWAWQRRSGLGFLGLFFLAVLAPSSSFVPIVVETSAERRMYLPLAAVITLLVTSAYLVGQRWLARGRLAVGLSLTIFVAAALGILTFQRNQVYRDTVTLWKDTVKTAPDNASAYNNLGSALLAQGQPLEAILQFQQAIKIDPQDAKAYSNWGSALSALGKPAQAIEQIQQAIRIQPRYDDAQINWGVALVALGKPAQAVDHFQQAVRINPNHAVAHYNLGNVLAALRQFPEAFEQFQQAVQVDPHYADAQYGWGNALAASERFGESIEHYEQALKLKPDFAKAHNNLGDVLVLVGRPTEALMQFEQAVKIDPDYAEAHNNWGIVLAKFGRWGEAIEQFQKAVRIQPNSADAQAKLADAYAAAGQFDAALAAAQAAWQLAQAAGQNSLAAEIQMRLQLYRDKKRYHEK